MTTPTLEELGLVGPDTDRRAEAELTLGRRLRAWGAVHRQSIVVLSLLLIVVAVLHAWGAGHAPSLNASVTA